ncbi:MAG: hypothetical protein ACFFBJ_10615, partial [Promethearchaeota archaeon]
GPPKELICKDESLEIQRGVERSVIKLITNGTWDLESLDFMIPPIGTWPEPESIASGGSNGINMDSYVLALKSKETNREQHLWIRRRPDDYLSCTLLQTQGMIRLETLENASQKVGQVLLNSISDHSETFQSDDKFTSLVAKLFA